mgnify:CR=1 FL=1
MVDERDVFETNVNTDGRKQYDWESKYPECAQKEMKKEAIYIAIILIIAFSLLSCIAGLLVSGQKILEIFLAMDFCVRCFCCRVHGPFRLY